LRNRTMRWLAAGDDKKHSAALVATKSHTHTHITQCDSQAQLHCVHTHTHTHMRCGMYYLYLSITSTMRPKMDPLNKRRSKSFESGEMDKMGGCPSHHFLL
jgi:hypothetical protein